MEAASLGLAIIPILVSAAENYRSTHDAFRRLRKASNEAEQLYMDILMQRALFDHTCRNLLEDCDVESSKIAGMLRDHNDAGWTGNALKSKVDQVFGDHSGSFIDVLHMIQNELKEIENEASRYLSRKRPLLWKMRLTIMKPTLDKSIERINRLNNNLNEIRARVNSLNHSRDPEAQKFRLSGGSNPRPRNRPKAFRDFETIHRVSESLYEALAVGCEWHEQHCVLLGLDPLVHTISRCVQLECIMRKPSERFWVLGRDRIERCSIESLPITNPQHVPWDANTPHVSFQTPSRSLCEIFLKTTTTIQSRPRIGFLQQGFEKEFKVFLNTAIQTSISVPFIHTLAETFALKKGDGLRALNPYESVRLGRKLAMAVLHFHPTTWSLQSWNSRSIRLLQPPTTGTNLAREGENPYIDVVIQNSQTGETIERENHCRFIENQLLFQLGVILLELAYEQPLLEMQVPEDTEDGVMVAEFNTAKRIRDQAGNVFGPAYARIVGQCLKCNFRSGSSDLKDPALQENFYRDVICKLGSLEQKLKKIYA